MYKTEIVTVLLILEFGLPILIIVFGVLLMGFDFFTGWLDDSRDHERRPERGSSHLERDY